MGVGVRVTTTFFRAISFLILTERKPKTSSVGVVTVIEDDVVLPFELWVNDPCLAT
jgi:hypothetical protein